MAKAATGRPKVKKPKPKPTAKERHKRFVDMAHEVGADESQEAFDLAFARVMHSKPIGASVNLSGAHSKSRPS
jgi:hypothetical protein